MALSPTSSRGVTLGNVTTITGTPTAGQILKASSATAASWATEVISVISDSTLSGTAASFDLTSIPATFAHLRLALYVRTDRAAATDTLTMQFNGDSGANYLGQYVQGNAASATAFEFDNPAITTLNFGLCASASATASHWTQIDVALNNYAGTTGFKTVTALDGTSTGTVGTTQTIRIWAGQWISASAISRITIASLTSSNFIIGSRCTLYGLTSS